MVTPTDPPNLKKGGGRQARVPNYRPAELTPEQREKRYGRRFRYQLGLQIAGKPYSKELLAYFHRGLTGLDSNCEDDDD